MSEVTFKSIDITNFMQIEHATQKLEDLGLVLITGENLDDTSAISNGAGKSTVADAICWALFGITARESTADEIINRKAGKGTKVELFFTAGGDEYLLMRHRKHKTGKNRIALHCNGDDITAGTDKQTQAIIERVIGCSLEVFVAAIYAGQEQMPDLPKMTDKNLKLIVEESAGTTILQDGYKVALEQKREANKVFDAAETKKLSLNTSAASLKDRWESDKESRDAWGEERDLRLVKLKGEVKSAKAVIDALKPLPSMEKFDTVISKVEKRIKEMSIPPDDSEVIKTKFEAHDIGKDLTKTKRQMEGLSEGLDNIAGLIGTDCGECGRAYDEEHFDRAIEIQRNQLKAMTELCRDQQTKRDAAEQAHSDAQSAFLTASKLIDTTELEGKLAQLRQVKETQTTEVARRVSLDVQLKMKEKAVEAVEVETNPHDAHVERSTEELKSAARALASQKLTLQKASEAVTVANEVATIFSPAGVRGQILDNVVPFLNDRTGSYLGTLSDGNITAEWKTIIINAKGEERESFHIECQNTEGAASFRGLSGGEKRKVRVATAMALQDLVAGRANNPIKLFIADEVDDALDEAGLERLMAIFEAKARSVGTVFIISHNDIGDWVRNQITVRKEGGHSTIVEG